MWVSFLVFTWVRYWFLLTPVHVSSLPKLGDLNVCTSFYTRHFFCQQDLPNQWEQLGNRLEETTSSQFLVVLLMEQKFYVGLKAVVLDEALSLEMSSTIMLVCVSIHFALIPSWKIGAESAEKSCKGSPNNWFFLSVYCTIFCTCVICHAQGSRIRVRH